MASPVQKKNGFELAERGVEHPARVRERAGRPSGRPAAQGGLRASQLAAGSGFLEMIEVAKD